MLIASENLCEPALDLCIDNDRYDGMVYYVLLFASDRFVVVNPAGNYSFPLPLSDLSSS